MDEDTPSPTEHELAVVPERHGNATLEAASAAMAHARCLVSVTVGSVASGWWPATW
jgi:hypothetical protein